jgi:hypothetical protein
MYGSPGRLILRAFHRKSIIASSVTYMPPPLVLLVGRKVTMVLQTSLPHVA